jgi:hypothetical protein
MKISRGRKEPFKDNFGGVKAVFLFNYSPTVAEQQTGRYGLSVISYPLTQVYRYEVRNGTFSEDRGQELGEWSQTFSGTLPIQSVEDANELRKLSGIEIGLITLGYNGQYRLMGAFNGCRLTNAATSSGGGASDLNGYNITVTAKERHKSPEILDFANSGFYQEGQDILRPIPISDFISYWNFDSNTNDSIGSNNGIATSISYISGLIGNAADFNGISSRVIVNNDSSLNFGDGISDIDFSWITLVKFDALGSFPRIYEKDNSGNAVYRATVDSSNNKFLSQNFDNSTSSQVNCLSDDVIPLNNWVVLTTTYDSATKTLTNYIDNSNLGTATILPNYVAMESSLGDLYIGSNSNFGNYLNGQINAMAIVNKKITPEQVSWAVNKFLVDNEHLI